MKLTARQLHQVIAEADDKSPAAMIKQAVIEMQAIVKKLDANLSVDDLDDEVFMALNDVDESLRQLFLSVASDVKGQPSTLTGKGILQHGKWLGVAKK